MNTKKILGSVLSIAFLVCSCAFAQPPAASTDAPAATQSNVKPFLGRWDITIKTPKGEAPAWIELSEQGGELKALMVGRWGGVCPVAEVDVTGGVLTFASAKEGDCDTKLAFKGKLEHGKLTGSATADGWNSRDVGRCSCSGVEPDGRSRVGRAHHALQRKKPGRMARIYRGIFSGGRPLVGGGWKSG